MNERIKELAIKATQLMLCRPDLDIEYVMEKFAELIVKDCIKACGNHVDVESFGIYPIRVAMVTRACENNIKEHFNLETEL